MADFLDAALKQFGIELSAANLTKQQLFLDELLRWNRQINLTAIRDRDEALEKHLLDALILLKYLPQSGSLLDMGSGAGLPAIPLAIACPELQVTSIDSVGKKISFQKHSKRLLSLANLQPLHGRIEDLPQSRGAGAGFDFVVARALASFSDLICLAAPLLNEDGKLLLMKGPEGQGELDAYLSGAGPGLFRLVALHHYQLPTSLSQRQLIILEKNHEK